MKALAMDETHQPPPYDGTRERRSGKDRRRGGFPSFRDLLTHRRRRQLRRTDDRRKIVLFDHYGASIVFMVIAILLLSIVDAVLTLFLLSHGAVELNPVMAYFLHIGTAAFLLVKYGMTAVSVMIVLLLNYVFVRHLKLHARSLLNYFAGMFALVVVWELFLVVRYVL
jgi:Domain of unknown function (DUF5658)